MANPSQHNKPWTKAEVTQLKKIEEKVSILSSGYRASRPSYPIYAEIMRLARSARRCGNDRFYTDFAPCSSASYPGMVQSE
jgi:hypothetical protein